KNSLSTNISFIFYRSQNTYRNFNRRYLQYRREFLPNWYAKIDLSTRKGDDGGVEGSLSDLNDSVKIHYLGNVFHRNRTVRIGVERRFFEGIFTAGANVISG